MNKSGSVSVFVSGDICPAFKIDRPLAAGRIDDVFGDTLEVIRGCDLSVLSLEVPLTACRKSIVKCGIALKASQKIAPSFSAAGYDIACLANNHILDYGEKGLHDTTACLSKNGIKCFGVGKDQSAAASPLIVTKNGVRIAFIGLAETEFSCAEDGWGAGRIKPLKNCELISQTAKKVDAVILFVHGGNEFCPFPSPRMIELYRAYVKAGASAVIGSHAHVPQGYELYNGRPIFYSLGNFTFPWFRDRLPAIMWTRGMAVRLKFSSKTFDGFDVLPTVMDHETGYVRLMAAGEQKKFIPYMRQLCGIISVPRRHEDLWNAWCAMRAPEFWLNYMSYGQWPVRTREQRKKLAVVENMVRCEAHHEVGSTFLRLVRTRQFAQAKKHIPALKKLMRAYL